MKKITLLFLLFSTITYCQVIITPATFDMNQSITISIDAKSSATNCNKFSNPQKIYIHSGVGDDNNPFGKSVVGNWGQDDGIGEMTLNSTNNRWEITFIPKTYYNLTDSEVATITKMGMVFRNENGSQEFKDNGCNDFVFNVGTFQLTLNSPSNTTTTLNSGQIYSISASTSKAANFTLKANGNIIDQKTNLTNYNYQHTVNQDIDFTLEAIHNGETKSVTFNFIVKPTITEAAIPSGMKDGINFNPTDNTKATLVFYAPMKEFVHVIGDFNNWTRNNMYLLKKDTAKDRFWIELTGLTPQTNHMYQYLVDGVIKVADPYSTSILDPSNDQYINSTTYPNLPTYPTRKTSHAVTLLRTGDEEYQWKTTDFQRPAKTDLVIYELLIRDFDALHSFDAVKARLDYLQGLGINAIEFMPVNEFDGNESWGYNPSFHMALDKYYGTPKAFKQLIDECHRRGIAVIIDVVYNHASGQNPYFRMYSSDSENYDAQVNANSPFFNQTATHSYSVFNDLNHSKQAVKDYVKRTAQYWIEEFKVDGFRWDLTKGFTQNCTNNEGCTNSEQADRVAILKEYADYQWEKDADFYVIFEHLGPNSEETKWVNYRLNEGKGIMVWSNHNWNYSSATRGKHTGRDTRHNRDYSSDFSWISYKNRGWSIPANISYMESHDEERLMFENFDDGNSNGSYNIKSTNIGLQRSELAGAFYFTVPGPKMIWQFGELGYDISINQNGRVGNKPILWNYFNNQERKDIYNTWNKLIQLKLKYDIFKTSDFTLDVANILGLKKIQLSSPNSPEIKYITIVGNFSTTTQNINPTLQKTGVWYDLLDNNKAQNFTNTNNLISLAPGEFKILASAPATLATENLILNHEVLIYPNPVKNSFRLNIKSNKLTLFDINGKKVKEFNGAFNIDKSFNIQELKKGFYILKIVNSKGKSYKKLIIN
ncbi:alpha-amylase family glycosyl hydrolase [uncultured Polaribacter sp.]|uniref:alpha-amylase family glycosyl hydrolase n=1 Tax=uncultured Polaribacter sp. TaxID=174711 RepID=UPI0025975456|nr:alpha-amylase family glycosyl hydrolase [uncultured Polaribacter sp.]